MDKNFDEAIAGIRKAERGVEVREDIAQGMEYVKQYANTAITKASEAASSATEAKKASQDTEAAKETAVQKAAAAAGSASNAAGSEKNAKASANAAQKHQTGAEDAQKKAEDAADRAAAIVSTDKTLTVENAPADAKATGDELDSIMLMLVTGNLTFGLYTSTGDVLCASDGSALNANKHI